MTSDQHLQTSPTRQELLSVSGTCFVVQRNTASSLQPSHLIFCPFIASSAATAKSFAPIYSSSPSSRGFGLRGKHQFKLRTLDENQAQPPRIDLGLEALAIDWRGRTQPALQMKIHSAARS